MTRDTAAGRTATLLWYAVIFGMPILFILVPLASFLAYSFWYTEDNQIVYQLTLRHYVEFFSNETYYRVFLKTLSLACQVTVINLIIGYAVSYFIWRLQGRMKYALLFALAVPLLMSYIIKIYAMRSVLGTNGLINNVLLLVGAISEPLDIFLFNLTAVRITLSLVLLPFMILPIFVALEKIPPNLLHASEDLGATPAQTFRRVILPLSLPGTMVGVMFTLVLAIGDFLAPELVGGIHGFTYGRVVFSQFGMAFNWPFGAALSAVLLVVALAAIAAAGRLGSPRWTRH